MTRISTRALVLAGLLVALLLAGVVSYYASSSPDGLEHVAREKGFAHTAAPHRADDGPLAGYSVKGVDNARLSGGLAGVAGAVVVLVLAGGLTLVVRRRGGSSDADAAGRPGAGAGKV
jgi:cobalt/nickel transport protein